jgi:hypothetical protein
MVCPSATSEAEARWPRFGLVVVATTCRRDKNQMIRPLVVVTNLLTSNNDHMIRAIMSLSQNQYIYKLFGKKIVNAKLVMQKSNLMIDDAKLTALQLL